MAASRARREPGVTSALGIVTLDAVAHHRLLSTVGPFVATAFVTVALGAVDDGTGRLVVATSARALARQLGVTKDTASGALRALARRGHVRRLVQPRTAGRFAAARYVVRPPAGFVVSPGTEEGEAAHPCPDAHDTGPGPDRARAAARRRAPRRSVAHHRDAGASDQLGLFNPASVAAGERSPR